MTDRELMQQALDYLDSPSSKVWAAGTEYKIIQALRARLAQPEQEPQREWQGLTDGEVGMLTVFDGLHHVEVPVLAGFTRAIEAKLKEKNAPASPS